MFRKKDKAKADSAADIIEKVWGDSSNNDNGARKGNLDVKRLKKGFTK